MQYRGPKRAGCPNIANPEIVLKLANQLFFFIQAAAQQWEEAKELAMESCTLLLSVTSHLEFRRDRACFAQVSPRVADIGCSVAQQFQGPDAQY